MNRLISIAALTFLAFLTFGLNAQKFTVESFRLLENDVTAFVNPVNDLNDDGCALIKVQSSPDFAFSTPLGIVKRTDKTGEIWLYVPKGTKMITLKHPEWGVMRDYIFPGKLESHMSYELRVSGPDTLTTAAQPTDTRTLTVRDTLTLVRTDTVILIRKNDGAPITLNLMVTGGIELSAGIPMAGLMAATTKKIGAYIHASSNFRKSASGGLACDRGGVIGNITPFYSGKTRHCMTIANAGITQRGGQHLIFFEGIGYGSKSTDWQLSEAEGGGYARNTHYSEKGMSFELGAILNIRKICAMASVSSIKGKSWTISVGIGVRIGKSIKEIKSKEE